MQRFLRLDGLPVIVGKFNDALNDLFVSDNSREGLKISCLKWKFND